MMKMHGFVIFCHKTPLQESMLLEDTPPKINMEPENDGLEDDFPLPGVYSQVPC